MAIADDDGELLTIQAKAIIKDGEVHEVRITGISFAHPETVRDIAQEVIDATYGNRRHRRLAIFTHTDWQTMRHTEPESITVPVHTY